MTIHRSHVDDRAGRRIADTERAGTTVVLVAEQDVHLVADQCTEVVAMAADATKTYGTTDPTLTATQAGFTTADAAALTLTASRASVMFTNRYAAKGY